MKEEFFKPSVTVDTIIFTVRDLNVDNYRKLPEKKFQVLLVKRAGEPYKDKWSLPGTFVGKEERFEEAVNRCLQEKANIKDIYLEQLYSWGDPQRDPRERIISTSYMGLVDTGDIQIKAGNKCREVLNLAMKDALSDGFISYNPVEGTKQYKKKKPKIKILNKEQLKKLLLFAQFDNWYLEILLGVFCGLRKGEIMGLKFQDFDKEKSIIRIRRQLVIDPILAANPNAVNVKVEKYVLTEKPPKKNSYRNLRVPKIIAEELINREAEYEVYKKVKTDFEELDYISFNRDTGKPQIPNSFNSYLQRQCPKNAIPTISVHALRHMFATILIERTVPLIKIAALMGHDSPHTTFEIYCDIMDEREKILAFINNTFTPEILEVH